MVEHLSGRLGVENVAPEQIGALLRKMDVQRGVFGAQPARLGVDVLPSAGPAIAQPDADHLAICRGRLVTNMHRQLAAQLGGAVHQFDAGKHLLNDLTEELIAASGNLDLGQGAPALAEGAIPLGALGGLQAVLVTHLHEDASVRQRLERTGDSVTQGTGVGGDVVDDQVGQRGRIGAHAEVRAFLPRELPIRKTSPHRSRWSCPSSPPSSSFWMRVLSSFSSTPVLTRLGANALKRSLAGIAAPSSRSATF